jgi:hypothetical protein
MPAAAAPIDKAIAAQSAINGSVAVFGSATGGLRKIGLFTARDGDDVVQIADAMARNHDFTLTGG